MIELKKDQLELDPKNYAMVNVWLARGDGIAVYENQDLGHYNLGLRQYVSCGSSSAQIETNEPPQRMPDIDGYINWRYQLIGVYKGEQL